MRRAVTLLSVVGLVLSVTSIGGGPIGLPAAAHADPVSPAFRQLAGVGSATSDPVMSALSKAVTIDGQAVFGSFAATGSPTITTKDPASGASCTITRPSGDDPGLSALLSSANAGDGCVDFVRMAHPYGGPDEVTSPGLVYIPFAQDGLSFVVSKQSNLPAAISTAELRAIYTCDPSMAGIKALLPAAGSEQRTMWLNFLQIQASDVQAGRYPCIQDHDASGNPLAENDARVVDENSIMPFSVANYLAETGGVQADLTAGARLGTVSDLQQPPIVPNTAQYPGDISFAVVPLGNVPVRLSLSDLTSIYTCQATGVTPLLPPSGSTRTAFENLIGIDDSDVTGGKYPCIQTAVNGTTVSENDGRLLGASSVMPYSVSAYDAQVLGTSPDLRGEARLGVLDDTDGAGVARLPLVFNPAYGYPLSYHVYNAVPETAVNTSPTNEVFVGPNALVCQQSLLIAEYGFAPLAAGDAEPCGSLQHSTTSPLITKPTGQHATLQPLVALDNGELNASGAQMVIRHGSCTLTGSVENLPLNLSNGVIVDARINGPHCSVAMSAVYYSNDQRQLLNPEVLDQDVTNGGDLELVHSGAGYHNFRLHGLSLIQGDVFVEADFSLTDDSIGGVPGAQGTLLGQPAPGADAMTADNGSSHVVTLTWEHTPSAASYDVQRANGLSFAYTTISTVSDTGYGTQLAADTTALDEHMYYYRVVPVYANGTTANPSYGVQVVPAEPNRIKHYVALGDSYSSGQGAAPTITESEDCRRSVNAYAGLLHDSQDSSSLLQYAGNTAASLDIIACGGARLINMIPDFPDSTPQPQMDDWYGSWLGDQQGNHLPADYQITMLNEAEHLQPIDLVTLSIGGNDAGFTDVIADCVLGRNGCTTGAQLASYEATRKGIIDALAPRLAAVYDAVVHNAGDAPVYVVDYPRPFPTSGGATNCAMDLAWPLSLVPDLTQERMTVLDSLADELDTVISNTVAQENAKVAHLNFVDVRSLFTGHDICAGSGAWINPVRLSYLNLAADPASVHPNNAGWSQEATYLDNTIFGSGS